MKNLSLFVSSFALCASTSYAAINCSTLPTCESLGYNDIVAQCPNKSIKCPFDKDKGTCLHEAAIGEIAYFPGRAPLGKGWLPCDGASYPITEYPELYEFLKGAAVNDTSSKYGNPFCESAVQKYHGTCSDSTFAVPDYRGYFLRVAGMWRSGNSTSWNANFTSFGGTQSGRVASINTPQKEELPNITGNFTTATIRWDEVNDGAFSYRTQTPGSTTDNPAAFSLKVYAYGAGASTQGRVYTFNASRSNNIYSGSHVIPANYSVYAYIYAGRVVK